MVPEMKMCACGGMFYRHEDRGDAIRYRCKECRKSITVRNGEVSKLKGRPMKYDWRNDPSTEATQ